MNINEYIGIYTLYKIGCAFIPAVVITSLITLGSVCMFLDRFWNEEYIPKALKDLALYSTICLIIFSGIVAASPTKEEVDQYVKLLNK